MEFTEDQHAANPGPAEKPEIPETQKFARTDVLLMMSMTINVFLAVLVAWWAVSGIGGDSGSQTARNVERDISRLNAVIERLEHTIERQATVIEMAARAQQAKTQINAGGDGQAGTEAAPKMQRVLLPDGRLVIKAVQ